MEYTVFFKYTGFMSMEADSEDEAGDKVEEELKKMGSAELRDWLDGPEIEDIST